MAHGKIGEFVLAQETCDTYIERLELFFEANSITDASKKRAIPLAVCGPATYTLVRNLVAPKKPAEVPFADLVALVKAHRTSRPTVMADDRSRW